MVPTFAFEPHTGFGPVILGTSREHTREALALAGFPIEHSHKRSDHFCDSSIQVECDDNSLVSFIGVAYSPRFNATYRGTGVFDTSADRLFQLIAEGESTGVHEFNTSEYCFPGQIMTLWDADTQYDHQGNESRVVWAQVGLGNASYLAAIAKIRGEA